MHSPRQRTLRAHAKINLLLRILAREASGYHGIETLFQRIALHDLVHVSLSDDGRTLSCDGPTMPLGGLGVPEQNLAYRAAAMYADATGWETGWHIAIEKHIPVGGGLGGGSADAAAVLLALESMSPHPLGTPLLAALGAALGADVPFMLSGAALALAWARGDRMLVLPPLPPMPLTLVAFAHGVNTGAAYGAFARRRETHGDVPMAFVHDLSSFTSWANVSALAENDFERVVPALHPGVARVLPELQHLAQQQRAAGLPAIGMLSGSGATCYLLTPEPSAALFERLELPYDAVMLASRTD